MKETKIKIQAGCEVEKTEVIDGELVVTFKKKRPQPPKSWEDFCEFKKYINGEEAFMTCECNKVATAKQARLESFTRQSNLHCFLLPNRETAEAVLALCQLIQLRECYNQGWRPDWGNESEVKFVIRIFHNKINDPAAFESATPLYFRTIELRDQFLYNFRDLIEKLKPLYGIMEGGEK